MTVISRITMALPGMCKFMFLFQASKTEFPTRRILVSTFYGSFDYSLIILAQPFIFLGIPPFFMNRLEEKAFMKVSCSFDFSGQEM